MAVSVGTIQEKLTTLRSSLAELDAVDTVAVAFSGGVDSTLLLHIAHQELGKRVVAFTMRSYLVPARELTEAKAFCAANGIEHLFIDIDDSDIAPFADNPPDRCYLCKLVLFTRINEAAAARGRAAVIEGSNLDDECDYRPGSKALAELEVSSPLIDAGFTKADVRAAAHESGIAVWNKPPCACLATRLPYGSLLTRSLLRRIDAAETWLLAAGLSQVRVRVHGEAPDGTHSNSPSDGQDGSRDSSQDDARDGARDGARDSSQDGSRDSAQTGARDGAQDDSQDGSQDGSRDSAQTGAHGYAHGGAQDDARGVVARIECNEGDMELFASHAFRQKAYQALTQLGFSFVALDLRGFVSGSMNKTLY